MTEQDMPNSHKGRGKESYLRKSSIEIGGGEEGRKREGTVLPGELHRDRLQRKNKLDTDEDRKSQRMRLSQKIRTDG